MKIASYNVHKCRGVDGKFRPDRIMKVIAEIGADVMAIQEIDRRFGKSGALVDAEAIYHETGMRLLGQSDYEYHHGWHGNALLVRGDPKSYRRSRLKLPGFEPRGAIIAEIDLGEGPFRIIAAHLGLLRRSRVDQLHNLLEVFGALPRMPTVLLGDFNEWRRHRRSALGILESTFGVAPHVLSFPSRRPVFALDRIFGWPEGMIGNHSAHVSPLARIASDHLPLTAEMTLGGAREAA